MNAAPRAVPTDTPVGWRWAPAWVLAYAVLWPASRVSEAVLSLGALLALFLLAKARFRDHNRLLSARAWALTTTLFFAYWLPQLISAVDAFDPRAAFTKTLSGLRYLPFLWLAAIAVATRVGRITVFGGLAVLLLLWSLDLLLQALSGRSLLFDALDTVYRTLKDGKGICEGQAERGFDRFNGIFGTCNPVLGVLLASFSPFLLHAAQRRLGTPGWVAAALLAGIAILLAGSRASWVTYALVLLFSGWQVLGWKRLLALFAAGAVALVLLAQAYAPLGDRLERSAAALQGNGQGMEVALSGRAKIWGAAACMIRQHPLNGVGVRDFREAYPACDPSPAIQPEWGEGPALHAHQIVLEILAETGVVGLLLWLAGAALAWRAWRYATAAARERARPAMLALAVTVFPLNTHLAFHSSFWGGVLLLLVALYAGSLFSREEPAP